MSLRFEQESLHWKVDTAAQEPAGARTAGQVRGRVVDALRAAGKPVV